MQFSIGTKGWICDAVINMHDEDQPLATQLLYGESVEILSEIDDDGFVKVKNFYDGYEGFIKASSISLEERAKPTHFTNAIKTFIHHEPDVKTKPLSYLPFAVEITLTDRQENGFGYAQDLGWVYLKNLVPIDEPVTGFVETAKRFLNVPYLYGGRSMSGIDCSALVQLCLKTAGIKARRDAREQVLELGTLVTDDAPVDLTKIEFQKDDIIYFKGHVGMMVNDQDMIHANATAMCVSIDNLKEFVKNVNLPVTAVRRVK